MTTEAVEDVVSERTARYARHLRTLVAGAQLRAQVAGGTAENALKGSIHISDLRAYVEALCRELGMPEFRATTKDKLAEFAVRYAK